MTVLSVPDMSCDHCKASVQTALAGLPGAGAVAVDLDRGEVAVSGPATPADLIAALSAIGFPAQVIAGR